MDYTEEKKKSLLRVCFCHSESVFIGTICPYCGGETATYNISTVYDRCYYLILKYFIKTLFKKLCNPPKEINE